MQKNRRDDFHSLSLEEVFSIVSSQNEGLREEEVQHRLETVGQNVLPEQKVTSWLVLLLRQFQSFLIVILLAAAVISFILKDSIDAYIILAAVLLNVIVGYIQENKAEKALNALRKIITLTAKVIRKGNEQIIDATQLVPGDIVLLSTGDKIPADARIIEVSELEVNEAALTGESISVKKAIQPIAASAVVADRSNMVFTGTVVTRGSGKAVVVHTGAQTEIGHIAQLLHDTKEEVTALQKTLDHFAHQIGMLIILVSAAILGFGMISGIPFVQMFTTAVAVAVSAIPEGLVVAVTVILAIGMQRILKRNALVRNLQAAETLGSTSVICTDKTGTLTQGHMQVVSVVTCDYHYKEIHEIERHEKDGLQELLFALNIGALCNDAHVVRVTSHLQESVIAGNFTERALMLAALQIGLNIDDLQKQEQRIATIPFDSKAKFMATLHKHPTGHHRIYLKGAPEKVIEMCSEVRRGEEVKKFAPAQRKKFEEKFIEASTQGLRILALAYKDVPATQEALSVDDCNEMTFVGFVGIKDPLRPDIKQTFERTRKAGIRTVMITGDHRLTAQAIGKELGLPAADSNILDGEQLHRMKQEELNAVVQNISIYARVSPEDKLNIIHAWQSHGNIVAMTGDGVNDAPAIKAADIGVALGSGTDVAKEASDMVLLDDRYNTIVAAVEEGRGIFDNIRKVLVYLVSDSFSEVVLISTALIIGVPMPITAAQILWINLVADGLPSMALTMDPKEKGIMNEMPRSKKEPVMNTEAKILLLCISLATGIWNVFLFMYFLEKTGDMNVARSVVFASLSIDSLLYAFSVRSLRRSIFTFSPFSNPWLVGAVVIAFLIQLSAFYFPPFQRIFQTVPLGFAEWVAVIGTTFGVVALFEFIKYIFSIIKRKRVAVSV